MPVPDQVRDDGSGIQKQNNLEKKDWIPGQARNDNTVLRAVLLIATDSFTLEWGIGLLMATVWI
jgi:hypothetical protein